MGGAGDRLNDLEHVKTSARVNPSRGAAEPALRVVTRFFELSTQGHTDILDVTNRVQEVVSGSGLQEGQATVFVVGSTAGITTVEYEPGLVEDLKAFFERLAPAGAAYRHEEAWHDGNGYAHVRSAFLKTSFVTPFAGGKLVLGTWQQLVLIDFDNRPRKRRVVVQVVGR